MCGITGYISNKRKLDTSNFYIANKLISHRGPDDEGYTIIKNDKYINKYGT